MASWNDLINDRLGTFTIAADAAAIADATGVDMFLNDGIRDIIEQCRKHKPQLLPLFTATTTQPGDNTLSAINIKVIVLFGNALTFFIVSLFTYEVLTHL